MPRDLNDKNYKPWREAVLVRDGRRCRRCSSVVSLEVHHIKPWKNNKKLRYAVSNGVTMCAECHLSMRGKESEFVEQCQQERSDNRAMLLRILAAREIPPSVSNNDDSPAGAARPPENE